MFLFVVVQVACSSEGMATGFTLVWLFSCMYPLVDFQIGLLGEVLSTVGAVEFNRFFMVFFNVSFQISPACELNSTMVALSLKFPRFCVFLSHVLVEPSLPPAGEVTVVAFKFLCTMTFDIVRLQAGLPIANKAALTAFVLNGFVEIFFVAFQQL